MLTINTKDGFDAHFNDNPLALKSHSAQTLLLKLAQSAGIWHVRHTLASEMWPQESDGNAHSNLRHVLWRIRKALQDAGANPDDYLVANATSVCFRSEAAVKIDPQN
jgi:DNA-binding SARP family transcriptional activator